MCSEYIALVVVWLISFSLLCYVACFKSLAVYAVFYVFLHRFCRIFQFDGLKGRLYGCLDQMVVYKQKHCTIL